MSRFVPLAFFHLGKKNGEDFGRNNADWEVTHPPRKLPGCSTNILGSFDPWGGKSVSTVDGRNPANLLIW